jgi:hypothetical protein
MSLRLNTKTKEYVFVPVTLNDAAPDPGLDVKVAFPAQGEDPETWIDAAWDDGRARVLVGPGADVELASGHYDVWVQVTANPETPIRKAGLIDIT